MLYSKSTEWNSIRLGGLSHGTVTKMVGGGGGGSRASGLGVKVVGWRGPGSGEVGVQRYWVHR